MKRSSIFLMTLALIMLLCGAAYATEFEARGSAVATGVRTNYVSSSSYALTNIWVTNISGSDVDCRITVYDHDGDDATSYCRVISASPSSNSKVVLATGTGSFSLPAGATRMLQLHIGNTSRLIFGHAVIEWASEDTHVRKALVASLENREFGSDAGRAAVAPINGGQPF